MMSFVSKNKLPEEIENKLYDQLSDLFLSHVSKKDCTHLTYELFTKTERLMFAKRIAIIVLLDKNYSCYKISSLLNVSDSTVARINTLRRAGHYKSISDTIKRKEYRQSVIGVLESLFTLGMPGVAHAKVRAKLKQDIESWKAGV